MIKKIYTFYRLFGIFFQIKENQRKFNIGGLHHKSSPLAAFAAGIGSYFNVNHLGNVFSLPNSKLSSSQRIEKLVLNWIMKIVGAPPRRFEGYISSGGTESNFFLMWIGREFLLKKFKKEQIGVVVNEFTHYSVIKHSSILSIKIIEIPVSKNSLIFDSNNIESRIEKLYGEGIRAFLIPLTVGYSSTGLVDDIPTINNKLNNLKKRYSNIDFYCWIDGAAQALPLAFINKKFLSLKSSNIYGLSIDFHKLGGTALPSGTVIYRSFLRKNIEKNIFYLNENDVTFSGSRTGAGALQIWSQMLLKNNNEWKELFFELFEVKNKFARIIYSIFPDSNLYMSKYSLSFCIEINKNFPELPEPFEDKYGFIKTSINLLDIKRVFHHYRIQITNLGQKKIFSEFTKDLRSVAKKTTFE